MRYHPQGLHYKEEAVWPVEWMFFAVIFGGGCSGSYLRSLLVMGARAVLAAAMNKRNPRQDPMSRWARSLAERRGYWRAVVAIVAKNARLCWAVLQRGESFKMPA